MHVCVCVFLFLFLNYQLVYNGHCTFLDFFFSFFSIFFIFLLEKKKKVRRRIYYFENIHTTHSIHTYIYIYTQCIHNAYTLHGNNVLEEFLAFFLAERCNKFFICWFRVIFSHQHLCESGGRVEKRDNTSVRERTNTPTLHTQQRHTILYTYI